MDGQARTRAESALFTVRGCALSQGSGLSEPEMSQRVP